MKNKSISWFGVALFKVGLNNIILKIFVVVDLYKYRLNVVQTKTNFYALKMLKQNEPSFFFEVLFQNYTGECSNQ